MGEDPHRLKRQAPGNTADRVCPMALVADHRFTANYAMGSASLAASLMVRPPAFPALSADITCCVCACVFVCLCVCVCVCLCVGVWV